MVRLYRAANLALEDFLELRMICLCFKLAIEKDLCGKGIPGRGNSLYKAIESREKLACSRDCKSSVCWLYWEQENKVEEIGGSQINSLVYHAKEYFFS